LFGDEIGDVVFKRDINRVLLNYKFSTFESRLKEHDCLFRAGPMKKLAAQAEGRDQRSKSCPSHKQDQTPHTTAPTSLPEQ